MTEASVSFAGNLTDNPEVPYTEAGIARTMFRVAVSEPAGAGGVVLHRDRVVRPSRARGRVPGQGQPGSWSSVGSSSAAGPLRTGSARSTVEVVAEELGAKPGLGDGDHDQDGHEPGPMASSNDHGSVPHTRAVHRAAEPRHWPPRHPGQAAHLPAGGRCPHPRGSGPCRSRAAAAAPRPPSDPAAGPREGTGGPWARRLAHAVDTHPHGTLTQPGDQQHATPLVLVSRAVNEKGPLPKGFHQRGKLSISARPDLHLRSHEAQPRQPVYQFLHRAQGVADQPIRILVAPRPAPYPHGYGSASGTYPADPRAGRCDRLRRQRQDHTRPCARRAARRATHPTRCARRRRGARLRHRGRRRGRCRRLPMGVRWRAVQR
jgi:hypothetical protein